MAFCTNCGHQLKDGNKFCTFCGAKTNVSDDKKTTRETVFEGNLHKCPACGEILKSFTTKCPTCGHEFRDINATSSVKELSIKLAEIERNRPIIHNNKASWLTINQNQTIVDPVTTQKISLIESFPIPNSREDLFEFFIMASSNINPYRNSIMFPISASQQALSDAWKSKFEQAYQKAFTYMAYVLSISFNSRKVSISVISPSEHSLISTLYLFLQYSSGTCSQYRSFPPGA